jgi:hypothetical protein
VTVRSIGGAGVLIDGRRGRVGGGGSRCPFRLRRCNSDGAPLA